MRIRLGLGVVLGGWLWTAGAAAQMDAGVPDGGRADGAVATSVADAALDAPIPDAGLPLLRGIVAREEMDAGPADAAVEDLDGAVGGDAALDGSTAAAAFVGVSLAATAAFGWVSESEAGDRATFGELGIGIAYVRVPRLDLRLDLALATYDRTYVTRLPALDGEGMQRVRTDELRVRGIVSAAWDVLPHRENGIAADRAQLAPFLRVDLFDRFDNVIAPQTDFGFGLGVRGFWRMADALRLEGEWSWAWHPVNGSEEADDRLLYGTVRSAMSWSLGASVLAAPRSRLGLAWRGEWLAQEHSDRHAHAVVFVLGLDL